MTEFNRKCFPQIIQIKNCHVKGVNLSITSLQALSTIRTTLCDISNYVSMLSYLLEQKKYSGLSY